MYVVKVYFCFLDAAGVSDERIVESSTSECFICFRLYSLQALQFLYFCSRQCPQDTHFGRPPTRLVPTSSRVLQQRKQSTNEAIGEEQRKTATKCKQIVKRLVNKVEEGADAKQHTAQISNN